MNDELAQHPGVVRLRSQHSVEETLQRLESLLKQRGVKIFACIDFSGDAAAAGLNMPAQKLLIFGNPKAGTPLMQSVPLSGLDLPFKALMYEDGDGGSAIAYNDPRYLVQRHGLPEALAANLAAVVPLIEQAAR
jgi:uncharacterized protein (DUF302 family)